MFKGPATALLWPEDQLQVPYGQKTCYRSSIARRPSAALVNFCTALLWLGNLWQRYTFGRPVSALL